MAAVRFVSCFWFVSVDGGFIQPGEFVSGDHGGYATAHSQRGRIHGIKHAHTNALRHQQPPPRGLKTTSIPALLFYLAN